MKKGYYVIIFMGVFCVIASVLILFLMLQKSVAWKEVPAGEEERKTAYAGEEESMAWFEDFYTAYTDELGEFLDAFMELTYNCDYRERHYYDGAQAFMTEECYSYYVPMADPEVVEDTFVPYSSYLQGADYYYGTITRDQAICLARVRYSSSNSQADAQESFLVLSLIRTQGEWKIDSMEILEV